MKWFIYLYPKSWRRRYGDELMEVIKQTDTSFKTIIDLLLGIIDAWHIELSERKVYGFRLSQLLTLIGLINVLVISKLISLREAILLEQIALIVAMLSFFLAIVVLVVNMFKVGIISAFSTNTRLAKISVGLMGSYAVFFITFLVLAN
ncbi:hypothetical protein J416_09199 [Gracilibacillus halophilus YIM-C55.5]|uniref:Uncharacterized protein n=1 Tax=Gracilibacillus halophilus YIM-C55.5 TaxID=1308866 RepID=N4WKP7_9BACI|nr:hypothetical protein [Gracilibacillus halophilus]ENH96742.1 hypothetical protein J416_09199 [Gracilibacillus halophilus YIM-C55.5]